MAESRAGTLATPADLVDVAHLVTAYYTGVPDPENIDQQVAFGTSGHRGSSLKTAFNETHILATTQAICDYRKQQGYDGPLFIGRDTHGLSEPAWATALEVLVANDVTVLVDSADRYTPTPAVSHAIIKANGGRQTGSGLADGIVVTPSHNPPADGGFKYNPPHGGPADSDATSWIADTANRYLEAGLDGTVVSTRVDGMPHRVLRTGLVEKLESGSPVRGLSAAVLNAQKFKKMSQMSWRSMISDGMEMRHGKELTWSQVVMAANTPMLLKAGLVEGNTDAGVLASGQVAGILDDLPSCAELVESIVSEAVKHLRAAAALVD